MCSFAARPAAKSSAWLTTQNSLSNRLHPSAPLRLCVEPLFMSTETPLKQPLTLATLETLPPVKVVGEPGISEQFSQARIYRDGLRAMGHGTAVMVVLLGSELKRLHKLHGIRRGRPSANSQSDLGIKWEELVKREMDFSDETARNYMALAEQAKIRVPEFAAIAEELLRTPIADLPEVRRAELAERTRNLLPSDSAQQLSWDWGIAKPPANPRGGNRHPRCPHCEANLRSAQAVVCPSCRQPLVPAEEPKTHEEMLAEGRQAMLEFVALVVDHPAWETGAWKLLEDPLLVKFHTLLSKRAREVEQHVKTPVHQREALALAEAAQ